MTDEHLVETIVDEVRNIVEYEEHRSRREDLAQLPDDILFEVPNLAVLIFLDGRLRNPE